MQTKFVRVSPRTGIIARHRAGIPFSQTWKQVDVDVATLAAIEEDPYLEVSDQPTVLVEMPAATQAGAIETEQDLNKQPESQATNDGSTGESAAEGTGTGTASPVANEESIDEQNAPAGDPVNDAGAVDRAAADGSADQGSAELSAAETSTVDTQTEDQKEAEALARMEQIKGAIQVLNPKVAENWLADGRPATKAIELILGVSVSAFERDAVWNKILLDAVTE